MIKSNIEQSLVASSSLLHLREVQDDDDASQEHEINSNKENSDARNYYGEEPEAIYATVLTKSMRPKKAPVQNEEVSISYATIFLQIKTR